jgi:hypothetical protein
VKLYNPLAVRRHLIALAAAEDEGQGTASANALAEIRTRQTRRGLERILVSGKSAEARKRAAWALGFLHYEEAVSKKVFPAQPLTWVSDTTPLPSRTVTQLIVTHADGHMSRCSGTFVAPDAVLTNAKHAPQLGYTLSMACATNAWIQWVVPPLLCILACNREQDAPEWMKNTALPPQPLSEEQTRSFRACATQADCEITLNGCCDCANGGEDVAVNKARVVEFRQQFDCSQTHCNNEGTMAPCRSGEVSCVDGLCRYAKPKPRR